MENSTKHEQPWEKRLQVFLEHNEEQLQEPDARLILKVRAGDDVVAIRRRIDDLVSEYIDGAIPNIVEIRKREKTAAAEENLSREDGWAIFARAKKVFEYNKKPEQCESGETAWGFVELRPGDRLRALPDGRMLEQALQEQAQGMGSRCFVKGAFVTERIPPPREHRTDPVEAAKFFLQLQNAPAVLPPVAEALFVGKRFSLECVYDGVNQTDQTETSGPSEKLRRALAVGNLIVVNAWVKVLSPRDSQAVQSEPELFLQDVRLLRVDEVFDQENPDKILCNCVRAVPLLDGPRGENPYSLEAGVNDADWERICSGCCRLRSRDSNGKGKEPPVYLEDYRGRDDWAADGPAVRFFRNCPPLVCQVLKVVEKKP